MSPNTLRTLQVMLSGRVDDPKGKLSDGTTLRQLRKKLSEDLQATLFTDDPLFDIWRNEDAPALPGDMTIEQRCRQVIDDKDIVLVLYNGRAGWASKGLEGICMTELRVARDRAPHKVRIVRLREVESEEPLDLEFREYVKEQHAWMSPLVVDDYPGALEQSKLALRDAIAEMAHTQARQGSKRYSSMQGEALRWRHLDYRARAAKMRDAAADAFLATAGSDRRDPDGDAALVAIPYRDGQLLLRIAAIPAAMSVATARELVGQPFLQDHLLAEHLGKKLGGPVHVIPCHGGVTESQAIRQLGFPDATIVPADFGVYVADEVQKVQLVFLRDCTSSAATRFGVQSLLDWLESSEEGKLLVKRASARRQVVELLASLSGPPSPE